jgi:hypothetical protein
MHLSLERIFSTVALLSLTLAIVPGMLGTQVLSNQQSLGSMGQLVDSLLGVWAIDLILISLSVDEVSLTLSIIPFLCIFPIALMICLSNSKEFARIIALAMLTIVFVIARYLANSL